MYEWLKRTSDGMLVINNIKLAKLAQVFGTPLYILNEEIIRKNCRTYHENFKKNYPDYEIIYAGKAFLNLAILKIILRENLSLDVVSGGELYTAIKAGFPVRKIYFHGNNKTRGEIVFALKNNIGTIIVDNENELDLIIELLKTLKKSVEIQLRITPGIEPRTHPSIKTGQFDSKFGFNPYGKKFRGIVKKIKGNPKITLKGLHCHIGSMILDLNYYIKEANSMAELFIKLNKKYDLSMGELNLGGGLGIKYHEKQKNPPEVRDYIYSLCRVIKKHFKKNTPKLLIEPGRTIIGPAGITVYKIGAVKKAASGRTFVSVDGGMNDNPRVSLYQAVYTPLVANKNAGRKKKVTIAGRLCETGDILIKDAVLPKVKPGDYIVVLGTGAYNYSMSSNYNKLPRPAIVLINKNKVDLITKRETYNDLIRQDIIPKRLN